MAPTNVGYSFKEAISHFFRNWTTSLGAVITIFLSLFIIGLFIMGSAMLNSVIGTVEDQVVINAFISDDADQADVQAFEAELKTWNNVKSVTYKDKDDALAEYTSKMSGNADATMSALDGQNPLPASFRLKVNSLENLPETVKTLESLSGVESVESSNEVATTLVGIKTAIHVAGLTIVAILMVVSIIIIANTVRVTIFNRRREINIMKYVGATNAFIRFPFLVEGMVIGLISALIAFGLLWVGTHFLYQWVGQSASGWLQLAYQSLIPFVSIAPQMLLGFVAAGVLFGMVGSFIFVGKYLKV